MGGGSSTTRPSASMHDTREIRGPTCCFSTATLHPLTRSCCRTRTSRTRQAKRSFFTEHHRVVLVWKPGSHEPRHCKEDFDCGWVAGCYCSLAHLDCC